MYNRHTTDVSTTEVSVAVCFSIMQLLAAVGYLYVASTLLVGFVVGIPTISIKGSKLFTSDGNQFFVKGECWPSACSQSERH